MLYCFSHIAFFVLNMAIAALIERLVSELIDSNLRIWDAESNLKSVKSILISESCWLHFIFVFNSSPEPYKDSINSIAKHSLKISALDSKFWSVLLSGHSLWLNSKFYFSLFLNCFSLRNTGRKKWSNFIITVKNQNSFDLDDLCVNHPKIQG